jgi:hypothetical protein
MEQTLSKEDMEYLNNLASGDILENPNKNEKSESSDIVMSDKNERILRSGKKISINTHTLPRKYRDEAMYSFWSHTYTMKNKRKSSSCLTRSIVTNRTPNATMEQYFGDDCYLFYSNTRRIFRPDEYHKTKYKSSFNSSFPGYLTIQFGEAMDNSKKVKFDQIMVKFY